LGRARSGTLRVAEDSRGLAFQVDLPTTALANDVLALVERNDVGGMSFGFRVPAGGDHWPSADRRELRTVDLLELSLVHSWPAYPDTSVMARSRMLAPPGAVAAWTRRRILDGL
jgi:HK97 family phage prohead protease